MEYTESKADETGAEATPPRTHPQQRIEPRLDGPAGPWPDTAIERQMAAATTLGYVARASDKAAAPAGERRQKANRHKRAYRFGFGSFLFLLWLLLVGLIAMFTDFDRALERMAGQIRITERVTDSGSSSAAPISSTVTAASPPEPSTAPVASSASSSEPVAPAPEPSATPAQDVIDSSTAPSASGASASAPVVAASATTRNDSPTTPQAMSANDVLSVPLADISLRNRPELVEQLAQIYRAQLATNPSDTATRAALERLQERSLADIQALVAEGYVTTASRLLETVSLMFPELTGNTRYKYLVELTNYMRRDMKDGPASNAQGLATAEKNSKSPKMTSPEKALAASAALTALADTAAAAPKKPVETAKAERAKTENKNAESAAVSTKPEIRSVSMVPGVMSDGRFVPRDGGNVFMVELSYSNFAKAFIESNQATLDVLLGIPDDPLVLAEASVTISADRGTKSFAFETNSVQGYTGGQFQLNFMLNDEFLTSRTLRLSRPR